MAEMNKITSFKTFTQLRADESAAKLAEERTAKRGELVNKLATVLDEMDIATFDELDEKTKEEFISKAFGVVSEESEETVVEAFQAISDPDVLMTIAASLAGMTGLYNADRIAKILKSGGKKAEELVKKIGKDSKEVTEGNAFIYAAAKAKAEGKDEFEFNGKTYKVTLKADTGLRESEEVSESAVNEAKLNKKDTTEIAQKIADMFTQESADAKEFFKYTVSNAGGGVSPMSFDLDVEKTAKTPKKYADDPNHFGEYAGGSFVIKDEDDCWCVYNAAMGMAHIEKFSKGDLKLIESVEYVSEAVIVTGKRDANRVMKAYKEFFKRYPALGPNAMGVPAMHHVGAIKELYTEAMTDANFHREGAATKNSIKGRISPIDVKIADLNNATIRISAGKLMDICAQNGSIISGAAKWSGLAIVEGTALYLDSLNHGKYAEDLLAKFNATFESVELMEARLAEGNAFSTARLKAIKAGKKEFEFEGETYPLEDVDAKDKEAAAELTESETLDDYNQALEISQKYAIPVATAMAMVASVGVAAAISLFKKGKRMVNKWAEKNLDESFVIEGAKEEQEAMEIYADVAGPDGKYTEVELAKADMDLYMDIVTAVGHKGSKAKKIADEFRKIATMESVLCEATVQMDAMNPEDKDFLKFLKKHKVEIIDTIKSGPSGHPEITMQGKKRDLEKVLGDCDYGWCDEDLAEYIEESLISENYEVIFSDGMSQLKKFRSESQAIDFMKKEIKSNKKLREIAVYKPGMHSTTQTELVVKFWGDGSYLDNVSKRDASLAAKKLEESVEVNEARHSEIHKAAKKGSYPVTIVITNKGGSFDGKVAHQETVDTPAAVPAAMKVLYKKYATWGHTFAIEDSTGKVLFQESVEVNEAEVKSDEEFKEYAFSVLQQAFGDDFEEAKAQEVIDGLTSKHSGDYGAMVGALQSSLG